MFATSKKNKIESGIIVGIFILVITLIVYCKKWTTSLSKSNGTEKLSEELLLVILF